jgi:hypothetical protein
MGILLTADGSDTALTAGRIGQRIATTAAMTAGIIGEKLVAISSSHLFLL